MPDPPRRQTLPATPYGAWASPISADDVARGGRRIDDIAAAAGHVCWLERRPEDDGRSVLVCRLPGGEVGDLTPDGFDVRSRVHEYGGGAFRLLPGIGERAEGAPPAHAFVHAKDQRVYLARRPEMIPVPLTPADGARYADLIFDRKRNRLLAVQERPAAAEGGEPVAALVAISLPGSLGRDPAPPVELVAGADFYSAPRLSADGERLAWLSWNHPDMPWDATELRLADLDENGFPKTTVTVAGGGGPEAVQQPSFDAKDRLVFVSDRSGWWNLYRALGAEPSRRCQPLCPRDAEFGVPPWLFGMSTYAHAAGGIAAACCEQGVWGLVFVPDASADSPSGTAGGKRPFLPVPTPYTSISWLRSEDGPAGRSVLFTGAAPDRPPELVRLRWPGGKASAPELDEPELEILAVTGEAPDPRCLSRGRPIEFPSTGGRRAFAFFYPPKNEGEQAPPGAKPPLIVKSHGGPTAAAELVYDLGIQYWTSRGFAVVDVNYGGSTGYGRAYRESLRGRWGIVDVEDCIAAAETLAQGGYVDPAKLLVRGGSAGGYTTLAALAFGDVFAAGASHYGVADLAALARDTHKFESRYLDRLVGPWPARADLYRERSPLFARDRFSCPVIFFQGDEDRIVPPSQAEAMVEALRARSVPVAYLLFQGEQHGFRKAENIVRALQAELDFYGQVLGFEPCPPV